MNLSLAARLGGHSREAATRLLGEGQRMPCALSQSICSSCAAWDTQIAWGHTCMHLHPAAQRWEHPGAILKARDQGLQDVVGTCHACTAAACQEDAVRPNQPRLKSRHRQPRSMWRAVTAAGHRQLVGMSPEPEVWLSIPQPVRAYTLAGEGCYRGAGQLYTDLPARMCSPMSTIVHRCAPSAHTHTHTHTLSNSLQMGGIERS